MGVRVYVLEKIFILYLTIHYHYRSNLGRLAHSKDIQNTLMALYEASTYLYPVGSAEFADEDMIIRNATGLGRDQRRTHVTSYLSRMGIDTYGMTTVFGKFLSSDPKSHWLKPATTYATVERAIANPKAAAALGRRIWMSMVTMGNDALTADDIAEVLGPFRKEEAIAHFKILDENESGDIQLEEMVLTLIEAGRIRHSIYQGMSDMNHCINTLDWVALTFIGAVMVLFILLNYLPYLKQLQQSVSFLGLGLSFAVGRTFHHFLAGCVLVFFDHPFDIGDRVEVWNFAATTSQSLMVVRQSLLYTVFRRIDNNTEMQIANEVLYQKRIENVTRSGANRQAISLVVDFRTSFQDLQFLQARARGLRPPPRPQARLPARPRAQHRQRPRAQQDGAQVRLRSLKSNWSTRSSALLAACASCAPSSPPSARFPCPRLAAAARLALPTPSCSRTRSSTTRWPRRPLAAAEAAASANAESKEHVKEKTEHMLDVTGIQRGEEDAEKTQQELEEEAKRTAKQVKAAAEKQAEEAAMNVIAKIPDVGQYKTLGRCGKLGCRHQDPDRPALQERLRRRRALWSLIHLLPLVR